MNKTLKTKQNLPRNKKNKSRERKDVENNTANLHSQSFPPQKAKQARSAPASPNPINQQIRDDYVNRISCPIRRNFYEQERAAVTSSRSRKKKEFVPPQAPQNIHKGFPLIEGDKNVYKQKRNAKGVYFTKVEKQDSPVIQARYMWKVKKVENRAMNTKAPQLSTYARHQQREEEKRRRVFHEDIIRRGNLVYPKTSPIETHGDPHRNLTLTETMHVDIKPNYNLTNSPFNKNKSQTHKMYNYSTDRYMY